MLDVVCAVDTRFVGADGACVSPPGEVAVLTVTALLAADRLPAASFALIVKV
ncbi:hypothetical protein D3C76_1675940 [compost metagenome]